MQFKEREKSKKTSNSNTVHIKNGASAKRKAINSHRDLEKKGFIRPVN